MVGKIFEQTVNLCLQNIPESLVKIKNMRKWKENIRLEDYVNQYKTQRTEEYFKLLWCNFEDNFLSVHYSAISSR